MNYSECLHSLYGIQLGAQRGWVNISHLTLRVEKSYPRLYTRHHWLEFRECRGLPFGMVVLRDIMIINDHNFFHLLILLTVLAS